MEISYTLEEERKILGDNNCYCYGVDSGTGCFMSEEASQLLTEKMDEDINYYEIIQEEMEKNYVHTHDLANFLLDADSSLNIITFSSGIGDGCYSSYWGFDEADRVTCLVTDFNIIEADEENSY